VKLFLRSKIALLTVLVSVLALGVSSGVMGQKTSAATIRDCSTNSIDNRNMNGGCGAATPSELIRDIRANSPSDLKTIYNHFGLTSSKYNEFASNAKTGTAYRDGRIVVGGQTVGTQAWSIGRTKFSYSSNYSIGGKTYYKSAHTNVLNRDLPVMVLFDDKGVMKTAVLSACGNPAKANPVTPKYSCDLLRKTAVSGKKDTYRFTTKATATKNARLDKVVYDFGDGSAKVTKRSLSDSVTHTYTKPGNYTARVVVYVKLPGGKTVSTTSASCTTPVKVEEEEKPKEASYKCEDLKAIRSNRSEFEYTFVAQTSAQNATLLNADFDFGDGSTAQKVAPSQKDDSQVTTNHKYTEPGTYTIKATVRFEVEGKDGQKEVKDSNCETEITIGEKEKPTPTPELPNVGAGSALGLFAGASALGSLGYRFHVKRRLMR